MLRLRASSAPSPTEVPARVEPRRPMAPMAQSRLSSRLVLPERYGPHSATTRCAPLPGLPLRMVPVFRSVMTTSSFSAGKREAPRDVGQAPASVTVAYELSAVTRTQEMNPRRLDRSEALCPEMLSLRSEGVNAGWGKKKFAVPEPRIRLRGEGFRAPPSGRPATLSLAWRFRRKILRQSVQGMLGHQASPVREGAQFSDPDLGGLERVESIFAPNRAAHDHQSQKRGLQIEGGNPQAERRRIVFIHAHSSLQGVTMDASSLRSHLILRKERRERLEGLGMRSLTCPSSPCGRTWRSPASLRRP